MDTVIDSGVADTTARNDRIHVVNQLTPGLVRVRLDELTADEVDRFLAERPPKDTPGAPSAGSPS
jgi:hypothetical protein